jgi:hypothetical protein
MYLKHVSYQTYILQIVEFFNAAWLFEGRTTADVTLQHVRKHNCLFEKFTLI